MLRVQHITKPWTWRTVSGSPATSWGLATCHSNRWQHGWIDFSSWMLRSKNWTKLQAAATHWPEDVPHTNRCSHFTPTQPGDCLNCAAFETFEGLRSVTLELMGVLPYSYSYDRVIPIVPPKRIYLLKGLVYKCTSVRLPFVPLLPSTQLVCIQEACPTFQRHMPKRLQWSSRWRWSPGHCKRASQMGDFHSPACRSTKPSFQTCPGSNWKDDAHSVWGIHAKMKRKWVRPKRSKNIECSIHPYTNHVKSTNFEFISHAKHSWDTECWISFGT